MKDKRFKPAHERATSQILLKVTPDFKSGLEDRAKEVGMPVGTLIKKILKDELEL